MDIQSFILLVQVFNKYKSQPTITLQQPLPHHSHCTFSRARATVGAGCIFEVASHRKTASRSCLSAVKASCAMARPARARYWNVTGWSFLNQTRSAGGLPPSEMQVSVFCSPTETHSSSSCPLMVGAPGGSAAGRGGGDVIVNR